MTSYTWLEITGPAKICPNIWKDSHHGILQAVVCAKGHNRVHRTLSLEGPTGECMSLFCHFKKHWDLNSAEAIQLQLKYTVNVYFAYWGTLEFSEFSIYISYNKNSFTIAKKFKSVKIQTFCGTVNV